MSTLDEVRQEMVQLWGRLGPFWGISPSAARVYAWLLATTESADGRTIADGLDMSRGAVSMACRELQDWGLVDPERVPGSRRICYAPETDLDKAIRSIVRTRKRKEWDPILENVGSWTETLQKERSREAGLVRERLEKIAGMVTVVDSMAKSFLDDRVLPRLGLKALLASAQRAARAKSTRT